MAENQELKAAQGLQGATFATVGSASVAVDFDVDLADQIAAAQTGVALCDRSHWGRIDVSDGDRLRFLHNQSTNDFMAMAPGQGGETVFVTSTARTVDLVSAYAQDESVLLLTHPSCRESLFKWMDRFIFFADKVKLTDRTDETVAFSLIGPGSEALLHQWVSAPLPTVSHHHQRTEINGIDVLVTVGSGLSLPGYTLIADANDGAALWQLLSGSSKATGTDAAGKDDESNKAVPLGETAWDYLRICQGRPVPGAELTDDYNPLEAGLWHTISFDKGCYIGQETIARLDTYNGVKQRLWGIRLPATIEAGTPLTIEGKKVGLLTSVLPSDVPLVGLQAGEADSPSPDAQDPDAQSSETLGLAYVKTKAGGPGLTVDVGGVTGVIVDVPYLTRSRQDSVSG